jgi:hypothetical protein
MKTQTVKNHVVLAYPYEGGLYYLLSRENPNGGPPVKGHPYYESLYGPDPTKTKSQSVNLLALFDTVLLPPADEYLPEHGTYDTVDGYYHPRLRIRVSKDWDFASEASDIASKISKESMMPDFVTTADGLPRDANNLIFIIARIIEQLRLAAENDAVIVGGAATCRLSAWIWELIGQDITELGGAAVKPRAISGLAHAMRQALGCLPQRHDCLAAPSTPTLAARA